MHFLKLQGNEDPFDERINNQVCDIVHPVTYLAVSLLIELSFVRI